MEEPLVQYDEINKVWKGIEKPYAFGNKGIGEVIYEHLKEDPNKIIQESDDSGEIYTSKRVLKTAISFARGLKNLGISKGDNILTLMDNHHYLVPTWVGTIFAEAIICPLAMTDLSVKDEIFEIVEQINPTAFITSRLDLLEEFQHMFKKLNIKCNILIYDKIIPGCYNFKPLLEEDVDIESFDPPKVKDPSQDVYMLTLSSATTGKPKLINTTHMQTLFAYSDKLPPNIATSTNKPGWTMENNFILGTLWYKTTRIITAKNYSIDEFLKMLIRHKVNICLVKPKDIVAILRSETIKSVDLSNIWLILSGGQHLSPKIANEFQQYLKNGHIVSAYGISDIGIGITSAVYGQNAEGSVGQIKANVMVKIINEQGETVGANKIGEIYVKSVVPFAGYYKNEEMSMQAMSNDGYYKTEDVGYVDNNGNLFLLDRKKFLISHGKDFINLNEIEKIILENVVGVDAVCVVDIEDKKYNVIPVITIIPEKDAKLTEKYIIDVVHSHYKQELYTRVFFFEALPVTLSGKYKKYKVREMVMELLK